MLHTTDYRELRNGKLYQMSAEREMSDHGSTEELVNKVHQKMQKKSGNSNVDTRGGQRAD